MEVKRNKLRRKSYEREFKLTVVMWFHENGKNFHQTSQHLNLDRKKVRDWVKAEEKIRKQKLKAKAPGFFFFFFCKLMKGDNKTASCND